MERDFLDIRGRDSGPEMLKGDTRGSSRDAGGSAVQWAFLNKASTMQQFMFHKTAQEEKLRNYAFDKHSSSRFQPISSVDAFEANQKTSHTLAPQKCFSLNRKRGTNQYPLHAYQPQNNGCFDAAQHELNEARNFPVVLRHNVPVTMSSPLFKTQSAHSGPNVTVTSPKQQLFGGGITVNTAVGGPVVGSFAPRNMPKPTDMTAQLTIFYAGCINVYDDVPLDKAQAIILLASKGSNVTSNAMNPRSEASRPAASLSPNKVIGFDGLTPKQTLIPTPCVVSPCSGLSRPISVMSHTIASSSCGSSTYVDTTGTKAVGPLVPTSRQETSKTSAAALGSESAATDTPRAVPQARKASLSRFLEKRQERMTNVMPYACSKITPKNGSGFESCNAARISSSADVNLSSN